MSRDVEFEKFISGFVAGEGCFYLSKTKFKNFHAEIQIKLHDSDYRILEKIRDYLKCGNVYYGKQEHRKYVVYRVGKIKDLFNIIIPFFERNPMSPAKKQGSFDRWKIGVNLIMNKKHNLPSNRDFMIYLSENINNNGKSRT